MGPLETRDETDASRGRGTGRTALYTLCERGSRQLGSGNVGGLGGSKPTREQSLCG